MIRLAVFASVTLLGVVACTDDPQKAATLTAPGPASLSAVSQAPARRTTVCLSYLRKRTTLQVKLADSPNDSSLQKDAAVYDRLLADACR